MPFIKDVGDTTVAKVAPYLILLGVSVGIGLCKVGNALIKERRE